METNRKIATIATLVLAGAGAVVWYGAGGRASRSQNSESRREKPVVAARPGATPAPQSAVNPSPRPQTPPPPLQDPLVAKLLSPDPAIRNATLRAFTRQLSTNDVATLIAFLENHPGAYAGLRPIAYNAIRNDVLDVLLRQDKPVVGLGARVAAMFRDPAHDDIWRDYCLQYLAGCYEAAPAETAPHSERDQITAAYWDAAAQSGKTFAGTALLGMETLSRQYPAFDRERVGRLAVTLAGDDLACEATRITSLRLCGLLRRSEALESARIVAQTGDTVPLRMAAIATLGDLGERQDVEYLQMAVDTEAPRLKPVIEAAAKTLRTRLGIGKG